MTTYPHTHNSSETYARIDLAGHSFVACDSAGVKVCVNNEYYNVKISKEQLGIFINNLKEVHDSLPSFMPLRVTFTDGSTWQECEWALGSFVELKGPVDSFFTNYLPGEEKSLAALLMDKNIVHAFQVNSILTSNKVKENE